ncbi:MAG: murein L,D-transpeptidase [Verrucomicrobia bacterium]|nr:murein L,D-transpeptidase [Verrucomicrobiota bacterium]
MYWVLALAGLAVLGWIWWQSGRNAETSPATQLPTTNKLSRIISTATNRPPAAQRDTNMIVRPKLAPPAPTNLAAAASSSISPPLSLRTNSAPTARPNAPASPRDSPSVLSLFETQLALARLAISPGVLDGLNGAQTRAAVMAFQRAEKLPITGTLDDAARTRLGPSEATLLAYTITSSDLARLQAVSTTWLGKSQQTALDFESLLELVAEKGHAHPNFIRRLNPDVDWSKPAPGTVVQIPNVAYPRPHAKAAKIKIQLSAKTLQAFDADGNLLAHFPCSIAQRVEKRPVGELHVAVAAPNPNYTFDPEVFPESTEARELGRKLILPPGPNNPVGTAWIGLDRPGYGIHGTPSPEQVGRTESHGCFRLANWDAEYLLKLVSVGTPVIVEP